MPRIKRRISRKSLKRNYNKFKKSLRINSKKFKKFKKYLKSRKNIKKLKGGSVPEFNSSNIDNLVILELTKINPSINKLGISFKTVDLFDTSKKQFDTSKKQTDKFTLLGNIKPEIVSVKCDDDPDYMILLNINIINPIINKIEIFDNSNRFEYSTYKLAEVFSYVFKHPEQVHQYLNRGASNSNLTAEQEENVEIFLKIKSAIKIQIYLYKDECYLINNYDFNDSPKATPPPPNIIAKCRPFIQILWIQYQKLWTLYQKFLAE